MFVFSTEQFGSDRSEAVVAQVAETLHIEVSDSDVDRTNTVLRKLAHLTEYAILSILLYKCLQSEPEQVWQSRQARLAVLVAIAYATTDEFHQVFVPGRNASIVDCCIDATGASLAMLIIYWRLKGTSSRAPS